MTGAAEPLQVSDLIEVEQLIREFNLRFDAGDAVGFADLFTEDGVLEAGSGRCATHAELRAKIIDSTSRPPHRHFTTNTVIRPVPGDPSHAYATSTWIYMEQREGRIETRGFGTYTDELVKRDGRWLFQHRIAASTAFAS
jgi:hypothetical protein